MAGEPNVTIVGRVGKEVKLNTTSGGVTVVNFSVAVNPRVKNKQTDQWEDGTPIWFSCTAWREQAENIADTLNGGESVIVTGRMRLRKYTRNDQTEGEAMELDVEHIGTLIAPWRKKEDNRGGRQQQDGGWATTQPPQSSYNDETPF